MAHLLSVAMSEPADSKCLVSQSKTSSVLQIINELIMLFYLPLWYSYGKLVYLVIGYQVNRSGLAIANPEGFLYVMFFCIFSELIKYALLGYSSVSVYQCRKDRCTL